MKAKLKKTEDQKMSINKYRVTTHNKSRNKILYKCIY